MNIIEEKYLTMTSLSDITLILARVLTETGKRKWSWKSRDGQIFFRPSCPLGNSPQCGCPGLIPGGIIVSLHLHPRKIQLPTGQPRFLLWLPTSISWLSRATGLPHFSIHGKVMEHEKLTVGTLISAYFCILVLIVFQSKAVDIAVTIAKS